MHNFKLQKLASMKDIRGKCDSIVDLSKFTSIKRILSKTIIVLNYNKFCPTKRKEKVSNLT